MKKYIFGILVLAYTAGAAWVIYAGRGGELPAGWVPESMVTQSILTNMTQAILLLGFVIFLFPREAQKQARQNGAPLRNAAAAFSELIEERFDEWALSPAERDVALYAIKGLNTAQIAQLRMTSEGTVKAQTNAIYRKAHVSGRPQLISMLIADLFELPQGGTAKARDTSQPVPQDVPSS